MISWLNATAFSNIPPKYATCETFHLEMSTLNSLAALNKPPMLVTRDVSQSGMSSVPAALQSAPQKEQHRSPEYTAARQLSTAVFKSALVWKGAPCAAPNKVATTSG